MEILTLGGLDYICNLKTINSANVSVIFWKLIRKRLKSVTVTVLSRV